MCIYRAAGKRFMERLQQHRDQQAQQDHDASGKLAEAHLIIENDDALE